MSNKPTSKIKPIGTKAYAIHKLYLERDSHHSVKIVVCKLKTYINLNGKVIPLFTDVNNKNSEYTENFNKIFYNLEDAVKALADKVETKKKK